MEFVWRYEKILRQRTLRFYDHNDIHDRGQDLYGYSWRGIDQRGPLRPLGLVRRALTSSVYFGCGVLYHNRRIFHNIDREILHFFPRDGLEAKTSGILDTGMIFARL